MELVRWKFAPPENASRRIGKVPCRRTCQDGVWPRFLRHAVAGPRHHSPESRLGLRRPCGLYSPGWPAETQEQRATRPAASATIPRVARPPQHTRRRGKVPRRGRAMVPARRGTHSDRATRPTEDLPPGAPRGNQHQVQPLRAGGLVHSTTQAGPREPRREPSRMRGRQVMPQWGPKSTRPAARLTPRTP